jgi:hypothetical protein
MIGPKNYPVSLNAFETHVKASEYLIDRLKSTSEHALYELLSLFNICGKCLDSDIDCISSIKYNRNEPFPVVCIDVKMGDTSWSGCNLSIFAQNLLSQKGYIVIRNLEAKCFEKYDRTVLLECIRQHEIIHILQRLSGKDEDLYLPEDLALSDVESQMICFIAAKGSLSYDYAFSLAGRHFLQHIKNEIDAYGTVDVPFFKDISKGDPKEFEAYRIGLICALLASHLWTTGCAFIDTYRIPWDKWVSSIENDIDNLVSGTFVEDSFRLSGKSYSFYSFLESIELETGIIRNRSLPSKVFNNITHYLQQVDDSTTIYNDMTDEAKKLISLNYS